MSDDYRADDPGPVDNRLAGSSPRWVQPGPERGRTAAGLLPWIVGALIVLVAAMAAGLGTAYLVGSFRAAPPPVTALPSPTLAPVVRVSPQLSPDATGAQQTPSTPPAASAEPSPGAPEATPRVHVVARGESISLIALQYDVTPEEIIALNELENPDVIVPGQELLIPPP